MDNARGAHHLFVCGLHRSGTSPLHRLLRAQAGVAGFEDTSAKEDEGQHLQAAITSARDHGGPGLFAFDPRASLGAADATPGVAAQLRDEWAPHWERDARWLIEKSPPNLVRMPFLQAVYPDSSFLVLERHPIVVSLATWKWTRWTALEALVEHWLLAHDLARQHADQVERARWLSYEEFVQSPEASVRWSLGLETSDPVVVPEPIRSGGNVRYFERWESLRTAWRTRRRMELLVARLEHRVRPFGYSLVDLDAAPAFLPRP